MNEPDLTHDAKYRLLIAAEEVFAEKGFAAATIREMTERANVNLASINYYFGDKERLYIETVKFAHECSVRDVSFPQIPETASPTERLQFFIHELAQRMTKPTRPSSLRLMMREMSHPTAAAKEIVREFIQPMAFGLRAILRDLFPDANETKILMMGFSIIGQVLFYRQNRLIAELIFGKEHLDLIGTEEIAQHVTKFSLTALGLDEPIRGERP